MVPTPRRARPLTVRLNSLANLDRATFKGPDLFLSDTPRFKRFIPPPEPISAPSVPHISALHAVEMQQLRAEISSLKSHVKSLSTTNKLLNTQLRLAKNQISNPVVVQKKGADGNMKEENGMAQKRTLRMKPESTGGENHGDSGVKVSSKDTTPQNQHIKTQRPTSLAARVSVATGRKPLQTVRTANSTTKLLSPKFTAKRLSSRSAASRQSPAQTIRS